MQVVKDDKLDNEVLIKPQKFHLDLRPEFTQDLTFTIGKSIDYPVDLYILCDLSYSMRDARNYLAEQVGAIIGKYSGGECSLKLGVQYII